MCEGHCGHRVPRGRHRCGRRVAFRSARVLSSKLGTLSGRAVQALVERSATQLSGGGTERNA